MKYILVFFSAWLCLSCASDVKNDSAAADTSETPATDSLSKADMATPDATADTGIGFAFSDPAGKQLLGLTTDSVTSPNAFTQAITTAQKVVPIAFKTSKPATANDNGRQTSYNFANSGGNLYEVSGTVDPEQTTVLCTQSFLAARKMIPLQKVTHTLSSSDKDRITAAKKRNIKRYFSLGKLDNTRSVGLVEFDRKKDSALVSLVVITPSQIMYRDFPALYNETSTWRVDDGGEFDMESFHLLAVFDRQGTLELVTEWIGAEGYALEYLMQSDKQLIVKKEASRYSAPD